MYRLRISHKDGKYRIRYKDMEKSSTVTPGTHNIYLIYWLEKASRQLIRDILYGKHGDEWREVERKNMQQIQKSIFSAIMRAREVKTRECWG